MNSQPRNRSRLRTTLLEALLGVLALIGAVVLVGGGGNIASAGSAVPVPVPTPGVVVDKVDICHAPNAKTNPYNLLSVSVNSIVPVGTGHSGSPDNTVGIFTDGSTPWGDIIPPFTWAGGTFPGQNWTAQGRAWFVNGCNAPAPSPSPSASRSPSPSPSPSASPTPSVSPSVSPSPSRSASPTPSSPSPTASATPTIGNLGISKTGTGSLFPGDELVWTLTVTNARGTPATGFTVTDALPAGTSYSLASGTDFTCTNTGQSVSCVYAGSLPVGASAQVVVRALLSPTYAGATVSNTAVVDPGRPDSDATDNTSTFVSTVTFTGGGGAAVVVPTPSPTVSPTPAPSGGGGGGGGGALPFTGLNADRLLQTGALLLLVGLLIALTARRRAER